MSSSASGSKSGRPITAKTPATNGSGTNVEHSRGQIIGLSSAILTPEYAKDVTSAVLTPGYTKDVTKFESSDNFSYMKVSQRKKRRTQKVILDEIVSIPSDEFQAQLKYDVETSL